MIVTIESPTLARLQERLKSMGLRARMVEIHRDIAEYMVSSVIKQFQEQGARFGDSWKPSQRATKEGGLTLIDGIPKDSEHLVQSFTWDESDAEKAMIRANASYAVYHQEGTKTMVARPVFPTELNEEDHARIEQMAAEWLERILQEVSR